MNIAEETTRAFINQYKACVSYEKIVNRKKQELADVNELFRASEVHSPRLDRIPSQAVISHDEKLANFAAKTSDIESCIERLQAHIDELKAQLEYIPERTQLALRAVYKAKNYTLEGYAALKGKSVRRLRWQIQTDVSDSYADHSRKYPVIW